MKYSKLLDGEQRLAVVEFEITHGRMEHGLTHLAMMKVHPETRTTSDYMIEALPQYTAAIKKAANQIKQEVRQMHRQLSLPHPGFKGDFYCKAFEQEGYTCEEQCAKCAPMDAPDRTYDKEVLIEFAEWLVYHWAHQHPKDQVRNFLKSKKIQL